MEDGGEVVKKRRRRSEVIWDAMTAPIETMSLTVYCKIKKLNLGVKRRIEIRMSKLGDTDENKTLAAWEELYQKVMG